LFYLYSSLFFFINADGRLYPRDVDTQGPGNDPPLTERSNAYERLYRLQREAIAYLETLPADAQVYYGHYEHFLLEFPQLGYASGPLEGGRNLFLVDVDESRIGGATPPCVYFLVNYPWLGAEKILKLLAVVEARADLVSETVREFRDHPYQISLIGVRGTDGDCRVRVQTRSPPPD
jgi:hypothetical protein